MGKLSDWWTGPYPQVSSATTAADYINSLGGQLSRRQENGYWILATGTQDLIRVETVDELDSFVLGFALAHLIVERHGPIGRQVGAPTGAPQPALVEEDPFVPADDRFTPPTATGTTAAAGSTDPELAAEAEAESEGAIAAGEEPGLALVGGTDVEPEVEVEVAVEPAGVEDEDDADSESSGVADLDAGDDDPDAGGDEFFGTGGTGEGPRRRRRRR